VNNAGISKKNRVLDARGYDTVFATNHLGHFQLTLRLYPALVAAHGARVVNVSSGAHRVSDIRWDDINFSTGYESNAAYGQSKTANILFAVELDRRWANDQIRGYALHPGIAVATTLADPRKDSFTRDQLRAMELVDDRGEPIIDPEREKKTPQQAAATIVFAAASPLLATIGGVYLKNSDIAPIDARPWQTAMGQRPVVSTDLAPYAVDPASAKRLWELTERMLGIST
jgi:NAD(P)-dependent dehydrogenase (short-subunit alcohol dehydrogenase family)